MDSKERKAMGLRVKQLRENRNLSQDTLADLLHMKRANISNYELGRGTPPASILLKLADIFSVTTDFLLGRNDLREIPDEIYELGHAIKEERQEQGLTQTELAKSAGITQTTISKIERDILPISSDVLEKITDAFGLSIPSFLDKHGLYDGYIPPHFDGDVDAYLAFKRAEEEDAMAERAGLVNYDNAGLTSKDALTPKDHRDIAMDLDRIMANLESGEGLAFYGEQVELDDEAKELLRSSVEQTMRLAKMAAKKKFTPKKYRKE